MYLGILQDLGLTLNEAKIYQTLIEAGELNISSLSLKAKIHRRNVYDILDRLIEKGLVFQILDKGDNIYQAVDPNHLLDLVKEKEDKLKKILPHLQKHFNTQPKKQQVHIYRGLEGLKNYWRDVLRLKQDVCALNPPAFWIESNLEQTFKKFLKQSQKQEINYRYLFNIQLKEQLSTISELLTGTYKFLPAQYSAQAGFEVLADRIVNISGFKPKTDNSNVAIYVIVDQFLADSYRQWFDFIWEQVSTAPLQSKNGLNKSAPLNT